MAAISPTVFTGPYTANGTQTAFSFDFSIVGAADIVAEVDGTAAPTLSYTVEFAATGGTVTFAAAPAANAQVLLLSAPDYLQTSEFENEGAYNLATINTINRRAAVKALVTEDKASRALKVPRGEEGLEIPLSDVASIVVVGENLLAGGDIPTVAGAIDDVATVAAGIVDVGTVAGVAAQVAGVAAISGAVITVAAIDDEVADVAGISAAVTEVAGNGTNINAVAAISANVVAVAGISANVTTVAGVAANVTTVATNIAAVNLCATNMAAINAAPNAATNAAASAANALANSTPAGPTVDRSLTDLRNLYDKTKATDANRVLVTGLNGAASNHSASGFIAVSPGSQFVVNKPIKASGGAYIAYFDSSFALVGTPTAPGDIAANAPVTVPSTAGIAFVRFTLDTTGTAVGTMKLTTIAARGAVLPGAYRSFGANDAFTAHQARQVTLREQMGEVNLFVRGAETNNSAINTTSGANVALGATIFTSAFMAVQEGLNLYINQSTTLGSPYGITYYDIDKTFLGGQATAIVAGTAYTYPLGTAYVRVTMRASATEARVEDLRITNAMADVVGRRYAGAMDKFGAIALIHQTLIRTLPKFYNLIDPDKVLFGQLVRGDNGTIGAVGGYFTTDLMLCEPGSTVIINLATPGAPYGVAFYDLTGAYVSGIIGATANTAFAVPANAYFWRTASTILNLGRAYAGLGSTLPSGTATFIGSPLAEISKIKCARGREVVLFGDSITRQNTWPETVNLYIDTVCTNYGIDGSRMFDALYNAMRPAGPSHTVGADGYGVTAGMMAGVWLFIWGLGANDFGTEIVPGTVADMPVSDGMGGYVQPTASDSYAKATRYNIRMSRIFNPASKVMFWTPIHYNTDESIKPYKLSEYVAVLKSVCAEEGVPVYDAYTESGIGPSTYSRAMADVVHPNPTGGAEYLGPGIARFIERTFGR